MLKIIIYEDNKASLQRAIAATHKALGNYDVDYKICKYLNYCDDLIEDMNDRINKKIYILDIEVPEVSGIELAAKIREKDWDCIIIFVTLHPECKNDIFYSRLMAYDYISKYNTYDKRLEKTIEEAYKIVGKKRVFSFKYGHILYRLELDDILYIEKINGTKKNIIYTESGMEYEIMGNLKKILEELGDEFALSHKSCIVNLNKVSQVDYVNGIIKLKNGLSIDKLSVRQKKSFAENLMKIK